jgi:hypothetical protein
MVSKTMRNLIMADKSLIRLQPMVRYFPKLGVWKKYITNLELTGKWSLKVNMDDFPRIYSVKILHGARLDSNKFANVPFLNFYHNPVNNIAGLTGVKHIRLHTGCITDIPSLPNLEILELVECKGVYFRCEMPGLRVLTMDGCGLKDISFITKLKGLKELNLQNNDIDDLGMLHKIKLRALNLSRNAYIRDLTPVTKSIKYLDVGYTAVLVLPPGLSKLKYLNLEYTHITNIPETYVNIETLLMTYSHLGEVASFEKLETISMRDSDRQCSFRNLPNLRYLEIGDYFRGNMENLPKLLAVRISSHAECDLSHLKSIETIYMVKKPYYSVPVGPEMLVPKKILLPPEAEIVEVPDD